MGFVTSEYNGADKHNKIYQHTNCLTRLDTIGLPTEGMFRFFHFPFCHHKQQNIKERHSATLQDANGMYIKHSCKITSSRRYVGRTEYHPSKHDKQKGKATYRQTINQSMIESLAHKCPVGSVPKSAEQEYNCEIQALTEFSSPVSSHRDIHIILEPGHKGYMPTTPEVLH